MNIISQTKGLKIQIGVLKIHTIHSTLLIQRSTVYGLQQDKINSSLNSETNAHFTYTIYINEIINRSGYIIRFTVYYTEKIFRSILDSLLAGRTCDILVSLLS